MRFLITLSGEPKSKSLYSWVLAFFLLFCRASNSADVETMQLTAEDVEVSYIYAMVLGTGTYKVKDRRITMFKLPFSWTQRKPTMDAGGWKWLLPVVAGYDDLSEVQSDWIGALLPDQLVTLSFLPGIEYSYLITPRWYLKPFLQLGAGREYSSGETIYMTQLGVRNLNLYELGKNWNLRWGNTLRWAAEYQTDSQDRIALGVFESGLDIRRHMPFNLFGSKTDIGGYYIYQRLVPRWRSTDAPDYEAEAINLHEIGVSIGLKTPQKILGINFQRVRMGYKTGGGFHGWTLGTEFPF